MTQETGGRQRPDPDIVRTEAERLVATGLAAVSMAADRIGAPNRERGGAAAASFDALGDMLFGPAGNRRHSVANDSPECCRCPVCKMIAAARQPSPVFAERLASGVGALAEGTARVLRGVAGATGATRPGPGQPPQAGPDPWAAATAEPPAPASATVAVAVATPKTVSKAAKKTTKKAVAKKAGANQTAAKKTAAKKTAAKQSSRSGSQASPKSTRPKKTTGNAEQ